MKHTALTLVFLAWIIAMLTAPILFIIVAWPHVGIASLITLAAYPAIYGWLRDFIGYRPAARHRKAR